MKYCLLLCVLLSASVWADQKQEYCWSYIKSLKSLYVDIKREGTEKIIAQYPPSDEGVSLDYARKLGAEIEADGNPANWLQSKWDACLENPQSVGR